MNRKSILTTTYILLVISLLSSCHKKAGTENYKPSTIGKSSELSIVIEDTYWKDSLGQELKKTFKQAVPHLPQDEPMFDLSQITPLIFKDAFLKTRNLLIVQIDPKHVAPSLSTADNVYARPQSIAYLKAASPKEAKDYIAKGSKVLIKYFLKKNRDAQIETNKDFDDLKLQTDVREKFGVDMVLTPGYRKATLPDRDDNFMWLDFNGSIARMGIIIYTSPYTNEEMFSKEAIITRRNELLQKYVLGNKENSYMTTEVRLAPSTENIDFKGKYAVEMRGLWKMENDFLGGPFVGLTILDEKNNRLITVEGFVSAPATDKRDFMRQVEAIVYSLSFPEEQVAQ
ncbi:MAG: DUF4837 family protein [Bacteroidales bacterium]